MEYLLLLETLILILLLIENTSLKKDNVILSTAIVTALENGKKYLRNGEL